MAILTQSGRAAIAESIKSRTIHLAWGTGLDSWPQQPPPPETFQKTLLNEIGRRVADEVCYCVGDETGELIAPTGRFRAVTDPTNNLYVRFTFDFNDAAEKTIRELGVMVGTVTKSDLPKGQRYFTPQDLTSPGILLLLEHIPPLIRTPATRETFCFVITF